MIIWSSFWVEPSKCWSHVLESRNQFLHLLFFLNLSGNFLLIAHIAVGSGPNWISSEQILPQKLDLVVYSLLSFSVLAPLSLVLFIFLSITRLVLLPWLVVAVFDVFVELLISIRVGITGVTVLLVGRLWFRLSLSAFIIVFFAFFTRQDFVSLLNFCKMFVTIRVDVRVVFACQKMIWFFDGHLIRSSLDL